MSLPQKVQRLSEAEYLAIERAAEVKSEFLEGEMFAMAGGSIAHSLIGANLSDEFSKRLQGHRCIRYNSELRVKVEATGLHTYPDLSVICGEPQFADGTDDTVVNPSVLVEVLSDSTEGYDRGKKFEHYREIPSLREFLLVSQWEPRIEMFVREEGRWLLSEAKSLDSTLAVPSLGIALSLRAIFQNVIFRPRKTQAAPIPRAV